jgi:3-deoxy-D-manno-octulosonic-acid transferase
VIWLHAVSVGEALAAVPLVRALQQQYPDRQLVITTTTPTGSERVTSLFAREIADKKILHIYAPYDMPFALNNFLSRIEPQLVVVMETELWPNMIHSCALRNIPVLLANARLSEKSARGYARISGLSKAMLGEITVVAAQNSQDGLRFVRLGLSREKLRVTGSIKFDLDLSVEVLEHARELKMAWSNHGQRRVLLAASTHPGEDEIILSTFKKCKERFRDLLLVLVPRHPERFNSIYQLCVKSGFRTMRRSEMHRSETKISSPSPGQGIDIVVGDTMGELLVFYGACDLAFVGGSFVPVGGHNLIEPAAWALPIVCGKYLFNFADVTARLKQQEALLVCETEKELQENIEMLLLDKSKRTAMGAAAQQTANENRGALQRLLAEIKPFL